MTDVQEILDELLDSKDPQAHIDLCNKIQSIFLNNYRINIEVEADILNYECIDHFILDKLYDRTGQSELINLNLYS